MSTLMCMVLLPYKRMAKQKAHEHAVKLRQQGTSIADISKQLKVSKSTVSTWCKDIALTPAAIAIIVKTSESKSTAALLRYTESLRAIRQNNISTSKRVGKNKLGKLSKRDIYCIGLGLYWGEGYKRGSQEFGFTNSDPAMIIFYLQWLQVIFKVTKEDLILRVSINAMHALRVTEVEEYWSRITDVSTENFTKTSLIKIQSKKIYANSEKHYGTLRIKVRRGTTMRREVIGAIESIA